MEARTYPETQATPSDAEMDDDTQSALQDAQEPVTRMNPISVSVGQDAQAGLGTTGKFQDTHLEPLRTFNDVIGNIMDVHPYSKMALGVLSRAAKVILAQVDHGAMLPKLLEKLCQVYSFITQDEMCGKISSMRIILGKISKQTRECAQFIKNYSETKNLWSRYGRNVVFETDNTIRRYNNVFDKLMENFRDEVSRAGAIHVHRTGEMPDLSRMTCAAGAGLDTRKECLQGTRTEVLSQITDWINSTGDNVPRVLWLFGPAGKGKSAIAHTIAKWTEDVGGLGSCYCFDRQREADRLHEKMFSTIARDLAELDPEMRRELGDVVQSTGSLNNTADIIQQWQKLLIEPLEESTGSTEEPITVVIDALDESGGVETRRDLLRILAGKHRNPAVPKITDCPGNLRFIVTSRPLSDITDEFRGVQHVQWMSMDDIPLELAKHDIHTYVSNELEGLDFQNREFEVLAEKADGLFEWARLACGYIKEPPYIGLSPFDCYETVVSRVLAKGDTLLHSMYVLILTGIMPVDTSTHTQHPHDSRSTALARFRSLMGQILGAAEPLPLASLNIMRSHFPMGEDIFDVNLVLKRMGSLLSGITNPNSPIRPLHTSFRDFLTHRPSSGEFFIDPSKAQRDLAFASLRVMKDGLRFNICDLRSSYLPNNEDPGLRERIQKCIPPHLSYSSQFWNLHVRTIDFDKELAKEVKSFFDDERVFFWLESLALIKALNGAVPALPLIAQWLKGHPKFIDVSSTAMDVQRFIQVFGGMILHSTPHLYVSALPLSPANSPLSRKFSAQFPSTLRVTSGRDMDWPIAQNVLSEDAPVHSASFSPDGTHIVTASTETVRLWDAATGEPVGEPLWGHTHSVRSVSFSPDSTRIVTGSYDSTVRLWNAATQEPIGEPLLGHTAWVTSVSFSPDGTRIVSGSRDQTVRLWNAATGKPVGEPLRGHTDTVSSVSFSPDSTCIVSGSWDKTVRLWKAATGELVGEPLLGHTEVVHSVSFSPDGTRIASGSNDMTVRLWNAATGEPVSEFLWKYTSTVNSVSFSPDGTRIVTGSSDKTVRLWNAVTGESVGEPLRGHTDIVFSASFSPDGARIITGSEDETVRLWSAATREPVGEPLRGPNEVLSVSLSPDGTRIVTGSVYGTVQLWNAATGEPVGEPLCNNTFTVNSVSFSPDGTRIVSGSDDHTVRLWNAATGEPISEPLRVHTAVLSVSFSPDSTRIVSGLTDHTVRLWNAATGEPVNEPLWGHTDEVWSVSFSPDGARIVTGSKDNTVRLWNTATGEPVGEPLWGHTSLVNSVSFSPDGALIVSGSWDNTVRLWNAATGEPVVEPLRGHTSCVSSVSFSPDGTRIVSGSEDKTVRLWDAATGEPVGEPLRGHTAWISSVSFSPDGTRIVSGSRDGTVRLWNCEPRAMETTTTMPLNTCNNHLIRFSPHSVHALRNTSELMDGVSHYYHSTTLFFLDSDSGWVIGPKHRLLFWVPPASRHLLYSPATALVIPSGGPELDLSRMAHGERWQQCRKRPWHWMVLL